MSGGSKPGERRGIIYGGAYRRYPGLDLASLAAAGGYESESYAARCLGIGNYTRVRELGFTFWAADRMAVKIGLHPAAVWGDAWWAALDNTDELREIAS